MNILYLHTHDTGRYIQPYGAPANTPNLMELAREGMTFRQAHCASPTCSPSRAALLTGEYPHQNGMWGLAHRGFSLFKPERHLAGFLAQNGFETALCGIQHETEHVGELGYQQVLGNDDYSMGKCLRDWESFDMENAAAAAAFISGPHDRPFFLSMGLFNTHRVYPELPPQAQPEYTQLPHTMRNTEENRADMAAFYESARIADQAAGVVLAAVKHAGLEEDTLIIFTTDHGLALPEMKCSLFDTGTGVSLLLKYPKRIPAGTVSDALVSHLDLFPTVCALADLTPPAWLQGASLTSLWEDKQKEIHEEIFSECSFHVAYEPMRSVRTQRYKYIRRFTEYRKPIACNHDDSPDKTLRLSSGYYQMTLADEMLFDLTNDPMERVNLAEIDGFSEMKKTMAEKLDRWMKETDDPLLAGSMLPPPQALVNFPDSKSPAEKVFIKDFSLLR